MIKVAIHFPWSSPFPILSIYVLTMLITPPSVFSSLSCWDCCSLLLHFFLASASSSAAVSCDCEGFILVVSGTTIDSGAANTSALSVCRSDVQQPFKEPLWLRQQSKKNWLIGPQCYTPSSKDYHFNSEGRKLFSVKNAACNFSQVMWAPLWGESQ